MKHTLLALVIMLVTSGYAMAQNTRGIDEEAILSGVNDLRKEGCMCGVDEMKGVKSLIWDQKLADIALNYAIQIKNNNQSGDDFMFLSHVGLDGSTVESRIADAGYEAKAVVENIAYMPGNEVLVIDYWLNNPLYCKNLMEKNMTVMGAARAGDYWVLIMAQTNVKKSKKK